MQIKGNKVHFVSTPWPSWASEKRRNTQVYRQYYTNKEWRKPTDGLSSVNYLNNTL